MFETVRDSVPLLEYRKVVGERFQQVIPELLKNYKADVPSFMDDYARRPEIADFDGELYIMGAAEDIPFHVAFIRKYPAAEYGVLVFTNEADARARAISVHGYDPEELLVLASYRQIGSAEADSILGDEVSEAGRFSQERTTAALASLRNSDFGKVRTTSNVGVMLKNYLTNYNPQDWNKAPLLIGHSGISKSATIKAIIKEMNSGPAQPGNWGYRLVDIRAAFFDKMDLLGMVTLTSETDGSDGSEESKLNERWTDSPKMDLLTCTTSFVESCRAMVTKIDSGDVVPTTDDAEFVARLREYAKTPVMFFDEINRTPKEVMNQLMVIINNHMLNDYDVSIAPKLAAANLPVEMDKLDDLGDDENGIPYAERMIYLVQNVTDAAKVDRFIPYIISSDDVTIQRAAQVFLLENDFVQRHEPLRKLLDYGFDNQILHDISGIDGNGKFPTFRGWEDTIKYIGWCLDNKEQPLLDVITGLVGQRTAREMVRQLEAYGVEVDTETDDTVTFVEHTYRSGLPMMLLGRMGIAKTALINEAIKLHNDEAIRIDLSSTDRVNVAGFPRPAPFLREAFGFGFKEGKAVASKKAAMNLKLKAIRSPLFAQFEQELKGNDDIPHQTTSYVPNKKLQDQLDKVRSEQGAGKRLVLVFDEINRCSPVVQSACFEAISDARLFGCDLRGIDYSVVAAGNYDDSEGVGVDAVRNSAFDASPIDTATLHRFATRIIRKVTLSDVEKFIGFLEKRFPAAHYVAEKMGAESLMEVLNTPFGEMADDDFSDDNGGMSKPVFTMRTMQGLHNMMVTQHPYILANLAMDEASNSSIDPVRAQAEAFLHIHDNPDLILHAVDAKMGYPLTYIRNAGLEKALAIDLRSDLRAKDVFAALRELFIDITSNDQATVDKLVAEFGTLDNFMFRAHTLIRELEDHLEAGTTYVTYEGLVPAYAKEYVNDAVDAYYTENSVKAAKGVVFDPISLMDESLSDAQLTQLISHHLGNVAHDYALNFGEMFISTIIEILDKNPDVRPSAAHLTRLKDLYDQHPLAAARMIGANSGLNARFLRFLNDYQNKIAGGAEALEKATKVVVTLDEMPKLAIATSYMARAFALITLYNNLNEFSRLRGDPSALMDFIERSSTSFLDLDMNALSTVTATLHPAIPAVFGSGQEAQDYLRRSNMSPMQLVALLDMWYSATSPSLVPVDHDNDETAQPGTVLLGGTEGHDGYIYPDYNNLAFATFPTVTGFSAAPTDLARVYLSGLLDLSRVDPGSLLSRRAKANSQWYVDLTYTGNVRGVSITLRASDVLAFPAESIVGITPDNVNLTKGPQTAEAVAAMMLTTAIAITDNTPAVVPQVLFQEGADNFAPYLKSLDGTDPAGSTAFLQLSFDVQVTPKGARTASEQVKCLEVLRKANATTDLSAPFLDADIVSLVLSPVRIPAQIDRKAASDRFASALTHTREFLPQGLTLRDNAIEPVGSLFSGGKAANKHIDMRSAATRMARMFRGVFK